MTDSSDTPESSKIFRLGLVSYLNVQPMIWSLRKSRDLSVEMKSMVPRKLAQRLYDGYFHTAIVPVFEGFRHPEHYYYLPGTAIAATNPVKSVILYSSVPIQELKQVYLDTASLTSVHLCKVLLAEMGIEVNYIDMSRDNVPFPLPLSTGWVVIGDPAMEESGRHLYSNDLAELWQDFTGLPFVFAAWFVPKSVAVPGLAELIYQSTLDGLKNLDRVANDVAHEFSVTPDFAFDYFQNHIHYLLGEAELEGWKKFGELCYKHNLIPDVPSLAPYPFG